MRVRVIVGLFAVLSCACGKAHRAGRSPKETMRRLEAALQDGDIGAVYDMMSARGQAEIEASLGGVRAMLAAVPESQLKAAGIAGFRTMSARDMLVASCEKAEDENPKALAPLKSLTIVVTDVRQAGDRATVRASVLLRGHARDETVVLVREGGLWKIDGNELFSRLPVPAAPALPNCSGPAP
jgi:hypothetical protein